MSLKNVNTIIGRLLSDEELSIRFALDPMDTIGDLHLQGVTLTPDEIDAFVGSDVRIWLKPYRRIGCVH
jgi:hypothetical protein